MWAARKALGAIRSKPTAAACARKNASAPSAQARRRVAGRCETPWPPPWCSAAGSRTGARRARARPWSSAGSPPGDRQSAVPVDRGDPDEDAGGAGAERVELRLVGGVPRARSRRARRPAARTRTRSGASSVSHSIRLGSNSCQTASWSWSWSVETRVALEEALALQLAPPGRRARPPPGRSPGWSDRACSARGRGRGPGPRTRCSRRFGQDQREGAALDVAAALVGVVDLREPAALRAPGQVPVARLGTSCMNPWRISWVAFGRPNAARGGGGRGRRRRRPG